MLIFRHLKNFGLILILTFALSFTATGQHGISMYHLKDATFQNSHFNPAYVPQFGQFFLGLPIISGINVHVSSKLSYSEIFTRQSDSTVVDISKAISNLTPQNGIYTHLNFNLLHLGFRLPSNAVVSLFANERVEMDFLFPKQTIRMLWEGNARFLEEEVKVGRFAMSATHFREIGLGFAYEAPEYGTRLGVRVKYLQGLFNGSLPANLTANVLTENENHQINVELANARFRTSGIDIASGNEGDIGTHLIMNGNRGVGVDLGMEYRYNGFYTFALAINDLGFIKWNENVTNYTINDTTFRYTGAQLKDADNIQDSLDKFVDVFNYSDDNTDPYTTMIPARIFGSMIWQGYPGIDVITTIGTRVVQGQPRFSFGIGGRYSTGSGFTGSLNITKLDQQFFNIGAAIATKLSAFQFYLASDHLIGYSAPNIDGFDIRLGINFVFSKKQKSKNSFGSGRRKPDRGPKLSSGSSGKKKSRGPKYGSFLGTEVKVKSKDEIYDVIPLQKKREPGSAQSPEPQFDKKTQTFPTSPKPRFENTEPKNATSEKPKFEKKKAISTTSTKPKFRRKKAVGGSSAKPKFAKKKTVSSRSSKPKFKKRKRRRN